MFEKRTRLRVGTLLEKQFENFRELEQSLKNNLIDRELEIGKSITNRSTNERNMTRKTRSRQPRIRTVFQSAVCHIPYGSLEDHIQSKRQIKLLREDGNFISIKGFDSFLALDELDALEVNGKNNCSPYRRRRNMPRTRTSSLMCDRIKSPMSPICDSGHHLRSRKNINYMTPPLEEDSLTEKPEYRELRSSSRLLAKLTDQIVDNDEVWDSGRPKRSCNKQRISADERLVVDNKSYYKVEVLSSKLRSGLTPFQPVVKRPETPLNKDDKGLIFKKLRNSELIRLNNEAENFLFPKKDESSEEEDDEDDIPSKNDTSSVSSDVDIVKKIKIEDEESMHSTSSESKGKKKRRTHAEAFIMDNQKYYKFETPGSRLRYHGSYLSPVPTKKNNGECLVKNEPDYTESVKNFKLNLNDYNFSFESVPKNEVWYKTFQRLDRGQENYAYLNDENYWDPFILPYQLDHVPPLDPRECISQYNQIKKCLMEPPSASTSVTCSTPDPTASNSSAETPYVQDEDSKTSAAELSSTSSTPDEIRPSRSNKRTRKPEAAANPPVGGKDGGKNPRKSPRQHASTLAILSSLIQQRKRKAKRKDGEFRTLPTIPEEPRKKAAASKKTKIDYLSLLKNVEEEFASVCDESLSEVDIDGDEEIEFRGKVGLEDILNVHEPLEDDASKTKRAAKPGRKPGKRKKNRTGWPLNRSRRLRRDQAVKEEEDVDDSTVDSLSANADSEEETNSTDSIKKKEKSNGENNNKNDQSSLGDVNIEDRDVNNADRVGKDDSKSEDKVLTNKVNNSDGFNIDLQYQPYVRVQKLDRNHIDSQNEPAKRSSSPKRTNRGQRRMPASPKSPRMLRRPRGRWYRER